MLEDMRALEKRDSQISRLMRQHTFSSTAEAEAYGRDLRRMHTLPPAPPTSPLEEAQEVIYEAFAANGGKRARLARRALGISPDCADAYSVLAENAAENYEEAAAFCEQGVQAGERALRSLYGEEVFEANSGKLWSIVEARPYLRARHGLAKCLWSLGRLEEATNHYSQLVRLDLTDQHLNREALYACLLEAGKAAECRQFLDEFQEYSTSWFFSNALCSFHEHGAGPGADKQLRAALRYNPTFFGVLLGRKPPPASSARPGQTEMAIDAGRYLMMNLKAWQNTTGAMDWLMEPLRNQLMRSYHQYEEGKAEDPGQSDSEDLD